MQVTQVALGQTASKFAVISFACDEPIIPLLFFEKLEVGLHRATGVFTTHIGKSLILKSIFQRWAFLKLFGNLNFNSFVSPPGGLQR